MQFKVPQFIDVEDKIFGPFTFRQFLYLAGGAGICFLLYKTLPLVVAIIIMLPVIALSLALTFYRVNEKPFIYILEAYIGYLGKNKLYVWKKAPPKKKSTDKTDAAQKPAAESYVPKLSESKLKDISWSLDVLDVNKGN
jgi:hypothetical protein